MRSLLIATVLAGSFLLNACSFVTSAIPGSTVVTGEAWYTKDTFFLIPLGTEIYYCPEGGKCIKAEIEGM